MMLKSARNRPLLIVISIKNASLKNDSETIMILIKKCPKNADQKNAFQKKHYGNFHSVFECIFLIRVFWTIFVKIVTVSLSFFGHSILMLITTSRARLRMIFAWVLKSGCNRSLLIVISIKIECPKNDSEMVTILTKIVQKTRIKKMHSKTLWKSS